MTKTKKNCEGAGVFIGGKEAGSSTVCPSCQRSFSVKANGRIRKHDSLVLNHSVKPVVEFKKKSIEEPMDDRLGVGSFVRVRSKSLAFPLRTGIIIHQNSPTGSEDIPSFIVELDLGEITFMANELEVIHKK